MIPIHLTIQAFGPYKDREEIDFSKFFQEKLFLITGNTGSGKTMIFDAICYALFGETSGQYRKVDTLRSQFADRNLMTYVEFKFSHRGKTYIITREPEQIKLSRGKEVSHRQTAKIIFDDEVITGIKSVNEAIKNILSIDYSQFKQIVMIAQGEFRKLVSADSKEREGIYRKIFNTTKFENIQNILKEKASNYDKKVDNLNQRITGLLDSISFIKEISYEENSIEQILDILIDEIKKYDLNIQSIINKKESYRNEINFKNELFYKFKDLMDYKEKLMSIDVESLKKEKEFLDKASKGILIRDKENFLNSLEDTRRSFLRDRDNIILDLDSCNKDLDTYEKGLNEAFPDNSKIEFLQNRSIELENLASNLNEKIKYEEELSLYNEELNKLNISKNNIKVQLCGLQNQLDHIKEFKIKTKDIKEEILSLEERYKILNRLREKFLRYKEEMLNYHKIYKDFNKCESLYNKIFEKYELKTSELLRSEDIYFRNQAGFLAEKLKDNMPCMVCGSTVHPNKASLIDNNISEEFLKTLKEENTEIKNSLDEVISKRITFSGDITYKKDVIENLYKELIELDHNREFVFFDIFKMDDNFNIKIESILMDLKNNLIEKHKLDDESTKVEEDIILIEDQIVSYKHQFDKEEKESINLESKISALNIILKDKSSKLLKYNISSMNDINSISFIPSSLLNLIARAKK